MMIQSQMMAVDAIQEAPFNWNVHPAPQVAQLGKSLHDFSQFKNIVVWQGYCIAGNGLLMAAKAQGLTEIEVKDYSHLSEAQAKALCVADNALPAGAEPDTEALQRLLSELADIEVPGVTDEWIDSLGIVPDVSESAGLTDADSVPDIADDEPLRTQPGDIWSLGRHFLMCGDSTNAQDVARLMNGKKADLCVTSPPYNQNLETFSGSGMHKNSSFVERMASSYFDSMPEDEYQSKQISLLEMLSTFINPHGSIFYNHKIRYRDKSIIHPITWLSKLSFPVRQEIIWSRPGSVTQNARMFIPSDERIYWLRVSDDFVFNDTTEIKTWSTVWKMPVNIDVRVSAAFNIELPKRCILASSNKDDIVIDPFCGSGTTLMACEQLGRVGYGMEISPRYVGVTLKRWEEYTGQTAVKL